MDPKYQKNYSEKHFWRKLSRHARAIGGELVYKSLVLYYTFQRKETPLWAKTYILGALGYLVSIIDALPDITPVVGYTDDLGVIALALVTLSRYIDNEVKEKARTKSDQILGGKEKKQLN